MRWCSGAFAQVLQGANLVTGQQVVALDFVENAPPATVTTDGADFVLPTTAGGGLSGVASSAGDLLQQVGKIPFKAIGDNLDGLLRAANDIANGPQLRQSLTDLTATLNSVKELVAHVGQQHGPGHAATAGALSRIAENDDKRQQAGAVARQRLRRQHAVQP